MCADYMPIFATCNPPKKDSATCDPPKKDCGNLCGLDISCAPQIGRILPHGCGLHAKILDPMIR